MVQPEIAVLYISYDGGLDNLAQSQIWPYLTENSQKGIRFHVVTFEKSLKTPGQRDELNRIKDHLNCLGIRWMPAGFRRGGMLTKVIDVLSGLLVVLGINFRQAVKVVHARSYVAGLLAVVLKLISSRKVIFDIRGFWVDERVESGLWKANGFRYRIWKLLETQMLKKADLIITLTKASAEFLHDSGYDSRRIMVIPTCVDTDRFRPLSRRRQDGKIKLVYAGSIGTWYLLDDMIRYFALLTCRRAGHLILITGQAHEYVRKRLEYFGIKSQDYSVIRSNYEGIPEHLAQADAGIAFYRPGFSRIACCPTKVGEYLSCGLAVVMNRGVGDCDNLMSGERVGVLVQGFSDAQLCDGVEALLSLLEDGSLRERCRGVSERYFRLRTGAEDYYRAYTKVMEWI